MGGSLIEVLISIVIASVALLALAGVNASSVRYTKMSQYRATAAQLAADMGERMRANKGAPGAPGTGFFAGDYDYIATFANQATKATLPATLCNLVTDTCSPAEIAALDLAQWRIVVRDQLPEGSVFILRQSGQVAADVWIAWRDPAVANADDAPAVTLECPDSMSTESDLSIRCSYFRINL
jgi:type IV pilus assembly protein PilV